jgi:prepilin-type N-terminal cleavage/methylation domain-containing protein
MNSKDSLNARKQPSQRGFTLLEILVVLTIMGFLIAMVAPRLAGISTDASETVCDSNKNRAKTFVSSFYEKFNRYPNGLTNLVMTDGTDLAAANAADAGYQIPYCSDDDPDNGPEVLPFGHNNAYKFMIHRLNADEAAELKTLGITKVFNLNDYAAESVNGADAAGRSATATSGDRVSNWRSVTAISNKRPSMESCEVGEGVGVAMCGGGIETVTGNTLRYVQVERGWAEEDIFGRIVFGLGPESELVTSGIVSNAAHCPGSIQNADNFTWGGYYLILPRLKATATRLTTASTTYSPCWGNGALGTTTVQNATVIAWEKDTPPSANYDISTNSDHFKTRTINLAEAMSAWDFDTNRQRYDEVWGIATLMTAPTVLNGGN